MYSYEPIPSAGSPRIRRILFMTHAESGQANAHFAVISSLLQHHSDVEIHLASFEGLRSRVPKGVTFHPVEGRSMRDTDWPELLQKATSIGTGFISSLKLAHGLMRSLVPYTPAEYITTANSAHSAICAIDPDLVVVDTLFQQGIDAVVRAQKKYCLLSPNTLKDNAGCELGLKGLAYPLLGIGYSYPISWPLLPLNAIAALHLSIHMTHFDTHTLALNSARHTAGYPGPLPMPHPDPDIPVLCMTTPTPGLDYPMSIPDRVVCCGPIVQYSHSVRDVDSELYTWLNREGMTTVLISLGTHYLLDEAQAGAVWEGVKAILGREDIQVLWKLVKKGEYSLGGMESFGQRLKVVDWIKNEPVDLLRSGKVGVVVHHGGSNSYHEALAAGIPQVILSGWLDTHDFGARVGYVGVGKWANERTAAKFNAKDITSAFLDVVGRQKGDATSEAFRLRAVQCREEIEGYYETHDLLDGLRRGNGMEKIRFEGRDLAAEWIWEYARVGQ